MHLLRLQGLASSLALISLFTCTSSAAVILESATNSPTDYPGFVIAGNSFATQYLGVRFHLTSTVQVTAVGGQIRRNASTASGPMFAAIFPLADPNGFPAGLPFSEAPLASSLIMPTSPSSDVWTPLPVLLSPGDYGLVFGVGFFGSPMYVEGSMPNGGVNLIGPGEYIEYIHIPALGGPSWMSIGPSWTNTGFLGRFLIEGDLVSVPEPNSALLCTSGFLGLLFLASRIRKA